MTQMVLIKEWLAYHVWMRSPVCPKVRLVTALLLPDKHQDRNQRLKSQLKSEQLHNQPIKLCILCRRPTCKSPTRDIDKKN